MARTTRKRWAHAKWNSNAQAELCLVLQRYGKELVRFPVSRYHSGARAGTAKWCVLQKAVMWCAYHGFAGIVWSKE